MPIFQRSLRHSQSLLDPAEQLHRGGNLLGPVHLGLHYIDAARTAVAYGAVAVEVVEGAERCDQGVEESLRNRLASRRGDGVRVHVNPDVAHQEQATPWQFERLAARVLIREILIERARQGLAVLLEGGRERSLHDPEPVAIYEGLVLRVDRRNGVLAVLDGGDRALHHHVVDARGMLLADGVIAIDPDGDVEAMVAEEHAAHPPILELEAGEMRRIGRRRPPVIGEHTHEAAGTVVIFDNEVGDFRVEAFPQGDDVVEKAFGPFNDPGSPHRIVGGSSFRPVLLADDIGAVKGIVEATPARIGRVQGVPGVVQRHHELRPRDRRDLRVHIFGGDRERALFLEQIPRIGEKLPVCDQVECLVRPFLMPGIDPLLVTGAHVEEAAVLGSEFLDDGPQGRPDRVGIETCAGRDLGLHQVVEGPRDPQVRNGDRLECAHGLGLLVLCPVNTLI